LIKHERIARNKAHLVVDSTLTKGFDWLPLRARKNEVEFTYAEYEVSPPPDAEQRAQTFAQSQHQIPPTLA
jgi:hypothetical protein